jgi:hypothetical protein
MTNQEAFDKMMNHLRSLSGQSVDSNGDCAYNGSKCAIGVLMTDEEQQDYGDFCDGVIVLLEVILDSGRDSLLRGLDENFLKDMQNLHDEEINWSGPSFEGEDEAEEIAKGYGLTYTKP